MRKEIGRITTSTGDTVATIWIASTMSAGVVLLGIIIFGLIMSYVCNTIGLDTALKIRNYSFVAVSFLVLLSQVNYNKLKWPIKDLEGGILIYILMFILSVRIFTNNFYEIKDSEQIFLLSTLLIYNIGDAIMFSNYTNKCDSENKSAHRLSNFIGNIIISIYFTWIIAWELVLTALKNSNPLTVGFMWIGIPILWGIIAFIVISICRLPFTVVAKE